MSRRGKARLLAVRYGPLLYGKSSLGERIRKMDGGWLNNKHPPLLFIVTLDDISCHLSNYPL
jgi:hypothetical protein